MFWFKKVVAPLALVAGIATCAAALAADEDGAQPPFGKGGFGKGGEFQPPFGKGGFPGQPPFGKGGEKKGEQPKKIEEPKKGEQPKKFEEPKKGEPKKGGQPGGPKTDATVDAWLGVLLTKITDPHDTVRDSARGAVVAVGPQAIPALERLANGDDAAKAVAARKLIGAITGGGPRGPQGPAFGGPGPQGPQFGGPGPMGPQFGCMGPRGPQFGGDRGPMGPMGGFGPPWMRGDDRGPMGPMGPMGGLRGGDRGPEPKGPRGPMGPGRGPDRKRDEANLPEAPMPRG